MHEVRETKHENGLVEWMINDLIFRIEPPL